MLIDVRPRIVKPPFGSVRIDWGHPLSRGLRAAWVMNEGGGPILDLFSLGQSSTRIAGVSWATASRGIALSFNRTLNGFVTLTSPRSVFSSNFSVVLRFFPRATEIDSLFNNEPGAGNANRLEIYTLTAPQVIRCDNYDSAGVAHTNDITYNGGGLWQDYVLTHVNGGNDTPFLNGVVGTSGAGGTRSGDPLNWSVAGLTGNAFTLNGVVAHFYLYDRALSAGESRQFFSEPYAFLRPVPAVRYWATVAAAAAAMKAKMTFITVTDRTSLVV